MAATLFTAKTIFLSTGITWTGKLIYCLERRRKVKECLAFPLARTRKKCRSRNSRKGFGVLVVDTMALQMIQFPLIVNRLSKWIFIWLYRSSSDSDDNLTLGDILMASYKNKDDNTTSPASACPPSTLKQRSQYNRWYIVQF